MPMEAQVSPLPRELTTPPVTKMCLVCLGAALVEVGKEVLFQESRVKSNPSRGGLSPEDEYTPFSRE
jgi:hypothetical protein